MTNAGKVSALRVRIGLSGSAPVLRQDGNPTGSPVLEGESGVSVKSDSRKKRPSSWPAVPMPKIVQGWGRFLKPQFRLS